MCAWIYGLLTRIEFPLHRDICCSIRSLCKLSINMKKHIMNIIHFNNSNISNISNKIYCNSNSNNDNTNHDNSNHDNTNNDLFQYIPLLNINILLSGVYFGQGIDLIKNNHEVYVWMNKTNDTNDNVNVVNVDSIDNIDNIDLINEVY